MDNARAFELVLKLARMQVHQSEELIEACNIVEDIAVNHFGDDEDSYDGLHCPNCNDEHIEADRIEADGNIGWSNCTCLSCGAEWVDRYVLDGFTSLTLPKLADVE